jgi:hypothetical protein
VHVVAAGRKPYGGFGKTTWLLVIGKRLGRWLQERDLVDGFGKKILLLVSAWKTEAGSKVSGRICLD